MKLVAKIMAAAAVAVSATLAVAPTPAAAAVTQTASCVDGGGKRWTARAVWGNTYLDKSGVRRTAVPEVGWTTQARQVKTQVRVQTFDGTGRAIQTWRLIETFDYPLGKAYRKVNPLDPPSAGRPKITVALGLNGDGLADCVVTLNHPTASDRYEADVLTATNTERTSRSLTALTADSCVDRYAETHAARLVAEKKLYHQDLKPILAACNLNTVGENVAYGFPSGQAVTEGWMNSSGHRANILNSRFRLLGVGAAQSNEGVWYAVQVFGARP